MARNQMLCNDKPIVTEAEAKPIGPRRSFGKAVLVVWLLFFVFFLTKLLGLKFLPSVLWVQIADIPALVLSIGLGIWAFTNFRTDKASPNGLQKRGGRSQNSVFWQALAAAASGWMLYFSILNIPPMLHALIVFDRTQYEVRVLATGNSSSVKSGICSHHAVIEGLPLFTNWLCGSLMRYAAEGDRLLLSGRGSSLGIYVTSIQRMPEG